jgi:hypothetical protein
VWSCQSSSSQALCHHAKPVQVVVLQGVFSFTTEQYGDVPFVVLMTDADGGALSVDLTVTVGLTLFAVTLVLLNPSRTPPA